jgi:HEPN domain-containing protein
MSPRSNQEKLFDKIYAPELLRIATGDLDTARALVGSKKGRVENALFHVQQAVEKSLKAVLVSQGIPVPVVHDIGILLAKLTNSLNPPHGYELGELNQYASIRRYEEGVWSPSQEELSRLITIGDEMLTWSTNVVTNSKISP